MTRRPAGLLALVVLWLGACQVEVSLDGARLRCPDGLCPDGLVCLADRCVLAGGDDAGPSPPLRCGDGQLDDDEACDRGDDNSPSARCTEVCQWARCGDGRLRAGVEDCDPGINPAGCTEHCVSCGGAAAVHDGRCYAHVASGTDLFSARDQCTDGRASAHLATITSSAEQAVLTAIIPDGASAWLGGYTGTRWVTGEPLSYTAWGPGEPSLSIIYNVLALAAAGEVTWATRDLNERHGHVCERRGFVLDAEARAYALAWDEITAAEAAARCMRLDPAAVLADLGDPVDPAKALPLTQALEHQGMSWCVAPSPPATCRAVILGDDGAQAFATDDCGARCVPLCVMQ